MSEPVTTAEVIRWQPPQLVPHDANVTAVKEDERLSVDEVAALVAQARSEGYQEGLDDAAARVAETVDAERLAVLQVLHGLAYPRRQVTRIVRQELLELARVLAAQILNRELRQDGDFYQKLITQTLQSYAEHPTAVSVSMHPEDVALLQMDRLTDTVGKLPKLISDERLPRGSCLFEVGESFVDAGVPATLSRLCDELSSAVVDADNE